MSVRMGADRDDGLVLRAMERGELRKIRDIDRTEIIRTGYRQEGARLVRMDVVWDSVPWVEGNGRHSYGAIILGAEEQLELGGTAFGAFRGTRLAGIAVYRPRLRPDTGQIALLHVSHGSRRQGIASRLLDLVVDAARSDRAARLYVSATPSESAVGFYLRHGFRPTDAPDAELLQAEPDDIHMVREL